jgi:hypothetical protein
MDHSQGIRATQDKISRSNLGKARTRRMPDKAASNISFRIMVQEIYQSLLPLSIMMKPQKKGNMPQSTQRGRAATKKH